MEQQRRIGRQTVYFPSRPTITGAGTVVGELEGNGPLHGKFDKVLTDDKWGEKSWELAERKMYKAAIQIAAQKASRQLCELDCMLGGDLLNQIISTNYAARDLKIPFLGLYGACSTMTESLLLSAMLTDGGFLRRSVCIACSHFSTAERQYRLPLEMGSTAPPTAQRTVTGAGAVLVEQHSASACVCLTMGTIGRVVDLGITDTSNMGAAMAPAASDTIAMHLQDTGRSVKDYDAVVTGDLGRFGTEMLFVCCEKQGIDLSGKHLDCGNLIFGANQNVNCGGSGCGCSASVLCAHFLPLLEQEKYHRILFLATGALMSPISSMQGESIPGIAHAIVLEGCERK